MRNIIHIFAITVVTSCAQAGGQDFRPLFNGKDLTGWNTTGNWVVEKDTTITLKPRPGESGWQRYKDFLLRSKPPTRANRFWFDASVAITSRFFDCAKTTEVDWTEACQACAMRGSFFRCQRGV